MRECRQPSTGARGLSSTVEQTRDELRSGLPYRIRFDMDWRVFVFLALVCLGTGIVFGLVPAFDASRTRIVGRLMQAGTGHTGNRRWSTRLVVAQLALTPVVLAGAGLMMRSIIVQHDIDPGVRTAGLVRMRLALAGPRYESAEQRARFYRQLEDRLVEAAGLRTTLASHAPFEGASVRRLSIDGRVVDEGRHPALVRQMIVGRNYFTVVVGSAEQGHVLGAADERDRH